MGAWRARSASAIDVKACLKFPPRLPSLAVLQTVPLARVRGESGPINSGPWLAMAIIETCGFHGTDMDASWARAILYHVYRTVPVPA